MIEASLLRRWEIATKRNIFRRCVYAHVRGIPVLPELWPMECKNDSIGVYPEQDMATANHYLRQHG
jgi:hypothetical protein